MTPEDLSWFVDDVVARGLQSVKGVGGVERLGGVAREVARHLKPDRLLSLGITAADVNRQLRLTSADMAGGRPRSAAGAIDPHARRLREASTPWPRRPSSCPATARCGWTNWLRSPTRPRSRAPSRGSTASRWWPSPSPRDGRERRGRLGRRRQEDRGVHRGQSRRALRLIDTSVTNTIGNYHSAMLGLIEGRRSRSSWCCCSCATGGRR